MLDLTCDNFSKTGASLVVSNKLSQETKAQNVNVEGKNVERKANFVLKGGLNSCVQEQLILTASKFACHLCQNQSDVENSLS